MEPVDRQHGGVGDGAVPSVSATVDGLERLLCDVIVAHARRENHLIEQIRALRADLRRQKPDVCDSDSGVGEMDQFSSHVNVVLNRVGGSLGFNISNETGGMKSSPMDSAAASRQGASKDMVVSRVNPDGPAQGKLCLQDCILEVNGIDVNSAKLDEAASVIKSACEPVVVEVLRQMSGAGLQASSSSPLSPQSPSPPRRPSRLLMDVACQTDLTCFSVDFESKGVNDDEDDEARCFSQLFEHSDELRKYDIEYEKVTLSKMAANVKLGLTICSAQEFESVSPSDVFIEKVDPDGVAGLDGRIKQGDQIIQVNGVDIHDHKEAIGLFEVHGPTVSLVVARPHLKECIPEEDEDDGGGLDNEFAGGDIVTEKDSGVRTDESLRNDDESCSEHDGTVLGAGDGDDVHLCSGVGSMTLDAVATVVKTMPETLDRSEAVELWVESTANGGGSDTSRRRARRTDADALDFCREMLFPLRPPDEDDDNDDDDDVGEMSSVACECCRQASLRRRRATLPLAVAPTATSSSSTVYTDKDNLERTIRLQQRLLRQSLLVTGSSSDKSSSSVARMAKDVSAPSLPNGHLQPAANLDKEMEWRVKRRSDGSRYVVRRPIRSRLLRDRAVQLAEERCGLTTDDDAMSELKVGRYWSKEDRKRHLDRAREHRRNKEEVIKSRNTILSNDPSSRSKEILEMSRRKMTRVRGRSLFDDFTTVEEVLAHGSSGITGNRCEGRTPHRLLSVTTV